VVPFSLSIRFPVQGMGYHEQCIGGRDGLKTLWNYVKQQCTSQCFMIFHLVITRIFAIWILLIAARAVVIPHSITVLIDGWMYGGQGHASPTVRSLSQDLLLGTHSLPAHIWTIDSHFAFCRHLKTYLFTVPDWLNLTVGLCLYVYT